MDHRTSRRVEVCIYITMSEYIFFWETTGEYGVLSQWHESYFTHGNATFSSVEQFVMYWKVRLFGDREDASVILQNPGKDPSWHRSMGRSVRDFDEEVWRNESLSIVLAGNILKFTQNPSMRDVLLNTGNKLLIEADPQDRIPGVSFGEVNALMNMDHWGINNLGDVLMKVRRMIKDRFTDIPEVVY